MRIEFRLLDPKFIDQLSKLASLDFRAMPKPWSLSKFDAELSRRRTRAIGAINSVGNLLGYVIYDIDSDNLFSVARMAVSPEHRLMGIGTRLLNQIRRIIEEKNAKQPTRPSRLVAEVSELEVDAWKFLRAYGQKSGMKVKTYLVRHEPDDYFGFTFSLQEQLACAS